MRNPGVIINLYGVWGAGYEITGCGVMIAHYSVQILFDES